MSSLYGTCYIILAGHAEDSLSGTFAPWTQAAMNAWEAEASSFMASAKAKGWPVHFQPTKDFATLVSEAFVRQSMEAGAVWDARSHQGAAGAAAVADILFPKGAGFSGVLGSYENSADYVAPVKGSGRTYLWETLTGLGTIGHTADATMAGIQAQNTTSGIVQSVILPGMADSVAKTAAVIKAVKSGKIPVGVVTQRFNMGPARTAADGSVAFPSLASPYSSAKKTGGKPILEDVQKMLDSVGAAASCVRFVRFQDVATDWIVAGRPGGCTYNVASL